MNSKNLTLLLIVVLIILLISFTIHSLGVVNGKWFNIISGMVIVFSIILTGIIHSKTPQIDINLQNNVIEVQGGDEDNKKIDIPSDNKIKDGSHENEFHIKHKPNFKL